HVRDASAARVDAGREAFPARVDHFLRQSLRKVVAASCIFVNVIGHHAGGQVVGLVEKQGFPGAPQGGVVGRSPEPGGERGELFGGQEQEFDIARGLLQLDAAAVSALEN